MEQNKIWQDLYEMEENKYVIKRHYLYQLQYMECGVTLERMYPVITAAEEVWNGEKGRVPIQRKWKSVGETGLFYFIICVTQ